MNSPRKLINVCLIVLIISSMVLLIINNKSLKMSNKDLTLEIANHKSEIINQSTEFQNEKERIYREKELVTTELANLKKKYTKLNKNYRDLAKTNKKLKLRNEEISNELKAINEKLDRSIVYTLTDYELDILQRIVFCEVGGEPEESQIAVANVIMNRLKSNEFPNTISEVIFQDEQFSPTEDGRFKENQIVTDKVKESVRKALRGEKIVNSNTVYFFATYIRSDHPIRNHVKVTKTINKTNFGE